LKWIFTLSMNEWLIGNSTSDPYLQLINLPMGSPSHCGI
jgi:hypothetical protein